MVRHILFTDRREGILSPVTAYRVSCFSNRKSINCVGSLLSFYFPSFWVKYVSLCVSCFRVDLNILLLRLC